MRRSTGVHRTLAERRAQLCLLGLKEIQRYWKINNNILDSFFQYTDEKTAKRLHDNDGTEQRLDTNSLPQNAESGTPFSDPTITTLAAVSGFPGRPIDFAVNDQSGVFDHNLFLTAPFNYRVDGMSADFGWLANSEARFTGEMDMHDIYMLQRCL